MRRSTALIALLLAALPWLLFAQYVSDDLFLYGYDAGQSHYARFKVIGQALRDEHGLALWQTGSYGGSPFHANLENPDANLRIAQLHRLFDIHQPDLLIGRVDGDGFHNRPR